MSIPGFTAELLLSANSNYGEVIAALPRQGWGFGSCGSDCMDACLTDGGSNRSCTLKCSTMCNSGPLTAITHGPPDPLNCDLCKAGCTAWWVGCALDVGVFTSGAYLATLLGKDWLAILGTDISSLL